MHPHDTLPMASGDQLPRMEVRPRLLAVFLGTGLIILAASIFAAIILRGVDADAARIVQNLSKHASIVARLRQEFLLVRVAEKNLIIEATQEGMDVFQQRIIDSESQIQTLLREFESPDIEPETARRLDEFREGFSDFRESLKEMIRLSREHTVAKAAVLSRGQGREYFQRARSAMMSIIERNRDRIVKVSNQVNDTGEIERMTRLVGQARDLLEGMHDLLYNEQAILTVFSAEERAAIIARLEARERAVGEILGGIGSLAHDDDREDVAEFMRSFADWTENSREVRRLAQEDSKARAMALSTSAVRDAYLRASQALDGMMRQSEESILELKHAQERGLTAGRGVLFGTAAAGVLVIAMTAWVAVNVVLREYRAAADVLAGSG